MNKSENTTHIPSYLYLIVSKKVWDKSLKVDELLLPSHHRPFIHLAKQDQISHVTKKFWAGADYVILKIETEKMIGRLVYEENPGGSNRYFHLYDGTIPLDAITEATFVSANSYQ